MLLAHYGRKVAACWWCRLWLAVVIVWEVLQGYPLYFLRLGCGGSPHGLEDCGLFSIITLQWEGDASCSWWSTVHCGFFAPLFLELDSINLQKVKDMKCYIPRFLIICWHINLERTVKNLSMFCDQKMLIHRIKMCPFSGVVSCRWKRFWSAELDSS